MGIKHLWTILSPFCDRKPLYELEGKTVAIDLSGWICEAQNIAEYHVQPRMYLRNLYFRTCYLLLMEVNPVFVLEGKAPEMKYDTIAARNAIQFKGAKPRTDGVKPTGKDRSRFNFVLKRCEEMLCYMGLACVMGESEAESLCAYLNEDGLVDGCISQDSDCFAYGAKVVYRNFSISQQGPHAAAGGAVDVYDIQKAIDNIGGHRANKFNNADLGAQITLFEAESSKYYNLFNIAVSDFGRNKIVGLALLCGSDYSEGVHGVGKEMATKLFENLSEQEVLSRIRSWKHNDVLYDDMSRKLNDKNVCTSCGHFGKLQAHTKSGCRSCSTTKGCIVTKFKDERLAIKNELGIRSKALADPNFPDDILINEFLVRKGTISKLNLRWKKPDVVKFVKFTTKNLQWEEIYAFEKIFPILTRWQLRNSEYVAKIIAEEGGMEGIVYPHHIKKVRNPKGVPSYEIIWQDKKNSFKNLIPKEQIIETDAEKLWSTIEPQLLVKKAYPDLVHAYEQSKIKPKKTSKRKQKKKNDIEEIGQLLANTSITAEPQPKKRTVTKPKTKRSKNENVLKGIKNILGIEEIANPKQKTVDSYFKQAILNNFEKSATSAKNPDDFHEEFVNDFSDSFNFDTSKLGDESDLDLSNIIENIVMRKPQNYLTDGLRKLNYYMLDSDNQNMDDVAGVSNCSSFFITNAVENDLFERSMSRKAESDLDDTEEYEVNDFEAKVGGNVLKNMEAVSLGIDKENDSFVDDYVPLYERLKLRK